VYGKKTPTDLRTHDRAINQSQAGEKVAADRAIAAVYSFALALETLSVLESARPTK
jgi:hypothetical protein